MHAARTLPQAALRAAIATVLLLLVPWLAMRFSDEVDWSAMDFLVAGALLFGAGFAWELALRKAGNAAWRLAAALAIGANLLLVWVNLAVGILGSERNPANGIYFAVPLIGIIGAVLSRQRPRGMALTALAMALAMTLFAVAALLGGLAGPHSGPMEILLLHGFFIAACLASAALFHRAASR